MIIMVITIVYNIGAWFLHSKLSTCSTHIHMHKASESSTAHTSGIICVNCQVPARIPAVLQLLAPIHPDSSDNHAHNLQS